MPHRVLNVPEHGIVEAYEAALAERGYRSDPAQKLAIARLQTLYTELLKFKVARRSTLRKIFSKPQPPMSVYFWGGVGRGKSFIMDCFFDAVPYKRKKRVHFHAFMQAIHDELKTLKDTPDPLVIVAERISKTTRLLCFDEFHVSDIADAMMLGRLLEALFERGVIFVMTTNYPPDGLYPNGLQRVNFLPTIELIKRRFDVIEVDDGTDYRLRTLEQMETYISPLGEAADQRMAHFFHQMAAQDDGRPGTLTLHERTVPVRRMAPGVIWFDFDVLCGGPRSQNDYLEIAREYHTLILSGVPLLNDKPSEARRLTWLIDVLYDHRVKLVISAAAPAYELYTEGTNAHEFVRTVSRLIEMRSRDYLAEPHRVDGAHVQLTE